MARLLLGSIGLERSVPAAAWRDWLGHDMAGVRSRGVGGTALAGRWKGAVLTGTCSRAAAVQAHDRADWRDTKPSRDTEIAVRVPVEPHGSTEQQLQLFPIP